MQATVAASAVASNSSLRIMACLRGGHGGERATAGDGVAHAARKKPAGGVQRLNSTPMNQPSATPGRRTRILTGITTSGTPHLGNYVGAIRPSVAASRQPGVENFYFLADYHALVKVQDPARVQRSTLE